MLPVNLHGIEHCLLPGWTLLRELCHRLRVLYELTADGNFEHDQCKAKETDNETTRSSFVRGRDKHTYIIITPAMIQVGETLKAPNIPQIMATREKERIKSEMKRWMNNFRVFTDPSGNCHDTDQPTKPECRSFRLRLLIVDVHSWLKCIHGASSIIGTLCRLTWRKVEVHNWFKIFSISQLKLSNATHHNQLWPGPNSYSQGQLVIEMISISTRRCMRREFQFTMPAQDKTRGINNNLFTYHVADRVRHCSCVVNLTRSLSAYCTSNDES